MAKREETIKINGKLYDATTGLPITEKPKTVAKSTQISVKNSKKIDVSTEKKPAKKTSTSKTISPKVARRSASKSQTLNRKTVKRPAVKKPIKKAVPKNVSQGAKIDAITPKIAVRPAPIVPKNNQKKSAAKTTEAAEKQIKKAKKSRKSGKITAIASAVVLLLIGAAVAAYFFIPAVSFEIATWRADIRGKLPTYIAENYRVSGPAQSSPGQITVNYKSGDATYSLVEQSSTWDSDGVLENKVKPNSKKYETLSQKGLTIFRFDKKAIWVNGGILYTISDDNNLSNDEILKIVDSI